VNRHFDTRDPARLDIRFAGGRLDISAEAATDDNGPSGVTLSVEPGDPNNSGDVEYAAGTVVEQRRDGTVVVKAPDKNHWFGRTPKLDVRVVTPRHSDAAVHVESADIRVDGAMGIVDVTTASGDVRLDDTASLTVTAASSDIVGGRIDGPAAVKTASGDVRLGPVGGNVEVFTASGDTQVAAVGGDATCRTASGDIELGPVGGSAAAKSASGDIRIDSITGGTVDVDSASGDVDIGIAAGTAAWLEVQSLSGDVRSDLDTTDAPGDDAARVTVRARTLSGDIVIRRAKH